MGRYNNRRTQAQAEAMKNTPSRARFSKGPPRKNQNKKRSNNSSSSSTDVNNNNKPNNNNKNQASQRVIDKIQNRVNNQNQQSSTSSSSSSVSRVATTEQALKHLDKSKLDELKLPPDILENISNLLEELGVKEKYNRKRTGSNTNNQPTRSNETTTIVDETAPHEDDDDNFDDLGDIDMFLQQQEVAGNDGEDEHDNDNDPTNLPSQAYQEYDDDYDDEHQNFGGPTMRGIVGVDEPEEPLMEKDDEEKEEDDDGEDETNNFDDVQDIPAFVHMTERLSFPPHQAARACRALGSWNVLKQDEEESDNKAASSSSNNQRKKDNEMIGLAIDWLCLHLTEEELARGFLPNANPLSNKSKTTLLSRTIKAIPHPSISIAKSITSDKEWTKAIKLQQRIVQFVKWGFHHSEASQACEQYPLPDDSVPLQSPVDDIALPQMLSLLEHNTTDDDTPPTPPQALNPTDLDYIIEEREQEREALVAIYDDQFHFLPATSSASDTTVISLDRYKVQITPAEDLQHPARQDECQLFVFLRPGYPVVESPSFLFTNPDFSPPLLRRINEKCYMKAKENIGAPAIFEVVTFLSEELAELQLEYIKEQRRKEFEAKQLQMRVQADHAVATATKAQYDAEGGKIGRRQRAKLKAAEKSYDRAEQLEKLDDEWRKKQDERMARVKDENNRVRDSMAQRAILKREQEWVEQEAEKAARAAMNDAFNQGESVEEARAAADEARAKSYKENGFEPPGTTNEETPETKEEGRDPSGEAVSGKAPIPTANTASFMDRLLQTPKGKEKDLPVATPMTTAFMDRLRQMYDDAVEQKAAKASGKDAERDETCTKKGRDDDIEAYHLEAKEDAMTDLHQPRPIAVPTGEMGEAMNDIISQQRDQPWLISTEARVPTVEFVNEEVGLTSEQQKRQQDISKKLLAELVRKRKQANDWATQDSDQNTKKSNEKVLFTPKKFHDMMSVRQR